MKLNKAKSFHSAILASLIVLISVGCGAGATSSIGSTGGQPSQPVTASPIVPAGWLTVDRQYFTYSYPSNYTVTESTVGPTTMVIATDPSTDLAKQHQVFVQFTLGFLNQGNATTQCAGVNTFLTDFYTVNFESSATDPNKFPQTLVTKDGPTFDGSLGGAEFVASVVFKTAVGSTNTGFTYQVQGVPRTDGLYLVGIQNPDYYGSPSFLKAFLGTLVMKSSALPKGSYCSNLN